MARKYHTTICREGWYLLVVLGFIIGGAMMREINLLMLIAGMMLGLLLYNWRAVVVALKGLEVRRHLPEGICAGDLLVVDLELTRTHGRGFARAVAVEDPVFHEGSRRASEHQRGRVLFHAVPAGTTCHGRYQGRLMRRGRYRFGPMAVSTRFPLGFVRRTLLVNNVEQMTVCPRLGRLTPAWGSLHKQQLRGVRRVRRQQNVVDAEFFGVRDWQEGDSRRSIHWRTSARRGGLVVKQSVQQRQQDLLVVIDLWQPGKPTANDLENIERAVSFAATVVADLCRHGGSQLDIAIRGADPEFTRGTASMVRMNELMEQLAVVDAHTGDGLLDLVRRARSQTRRDTTTLIVSTRPVDLTEPREGRTTGDALRNDHLGGSVIAIDASSDTLQQYFVSEL
ncbi:MAG: DUF58 domain-containing protein [Pirellulales bacterium]